MPSIPDLAEFQYLAIAAAIGFLIGFQREWKHHDEAKERTFAGARTFALIGFAGGLAGYLDKEGVLLVAVGLAGVAALTTAAYWAEARRTPGAGGTTEMAVLATYLLGVLATRGAPAAAAAGGVFVAILLALKPLVQRWAIHMEAKEIGAALRFLAISVIVLPILPDQGYGPYEALNPRNIWWMVVLISGLSFAGYWLTKLYGAHGVVITGFVGGLASSTATTISLSRLLRDGAASVRPGAAGIIAANVVMLARMGVLLSVVSPRVLIAVLPALIAGGAAGFVAAILIWRGEKCDSADLALGNPMELRPALFFAALLALITVASRYASDAYGEQGLYGLAFIAGFADVDAMTLTAGDQARRAVITPDVAGIAVLIAAGSNMLVKAGMTAVIAGAGAGGRVAAAFAAIIAAAAAGALIAS